MVGPKKKNVTVDGYIKAFPKDIQATLRKIEETIRKVVPKAQQVISYGIPAFKLDGRYAIYFAGWKDHISIYPIPKGNNAFQKELAPYKAGRGTIRFEIDEPIPYGLVKKIATFHLKESRASLKDKKPRRLESRLAE